MSPAVFVPELVTACERMSPNGSEFAPAYMLDQSHNVTDPIESLMCSAIELTRCYAQALLVDREIHQSTDAIENQEFESAVSHAKTARSIEPWAATPYRQLGLLAEANGEYEEAIHRFGQAIDRANE